MEVGTPTLVPLTTLRCRNMIVIGGLSAGDSSYVGQVLYFETSHLSTPRHVALALSMATHVRQPETVLFTIGCRSGSSSSPRSLSLAHFF